MMNRPYMLDIGHTIYVDYPNKSSACVTNFLETCMISAKSQNELGLNSSSSGIEFMNTCSCITYTSRKLVCVLMRCL
jgi:hypothetical protein